MALKEREEAEKKRQEWLDAYCKITIRMHHGGLQESIETMKECQTTKEAIDYLEDNGVDPDSVTCELYIDEVDERVGWEKTYLIIGRYKDWKDTERVYPLAFCDKLFTIKTSETLKENTK